MKTLKAVGYQPMIFLAADATYSYYHITRTLYRIARGAEIASTDGGTQGVQYASGDSIERLWVTDAAGELFLQLLESDGTRTLRRSGDYGDTFTTVHTFQTDSSLLERGLTVGYPGGTRTLVWVEYTTSTGTPNITMRTSTNGEAWTTVWTVRGGTGSSTREWRHFHGITWDQWEECFWIYTGDANTNNTDCMILKWDGVTSLTTNTGAAALEGLGFTVLYGSVRYRTVDVIPTRDHIYWGCDGTSTAGGIVAGDKGIWRASKTLTNVQRLDLGDARYDPVSGAASRSTMWTGAFVQDPSRADGEGHVLISTSMNTEVAGQRFESIFMAHTDDASVDKWREVGRIYTRHTNTNVLRAFNAQGQDIWCSFTRGAGKGTQGETAHMRLDYDRDFKTDPTGNLTTVEGMSYIPHLIPPMHPVFWVDITSGDDATGTGKRPGAAWKTFDKALNQQVTALITWGSGVVVSAGTDTIAERFSLAWNNYPTTNGYNGENTHPVWIMGEGIDNTIINCTTTTLLSNYLLRLANATDVLVLDNLSLYSNHTNSDARVIEPNAAGSTVYVRDSHIGTTSAQAAALRSGTAVNTINRAFRSRLSQGRTSGATSAAVHIDGVAGGGFYGFACILEGYSAATADDDGTLLELHNCLLRDFHSIGAQVGTGNTTGTFKALNTVFVDAGTSTGTSYDSRSIAVLDVRANAYTVAPAQVADQGTNGQVLITAVSEFTDGDPLSGLLDSSQLIAAGRGSGALADYVGASFKQPASIGHLEKNAGRRPATNSARATPNSTRPSVTTRAS